MKLESSAIVGFEKETGFQNIKLNYAREEVTLLPAKLRKPFKISSANQQSF